MKIGMNGLGRMGSNMARGLSGGGSLEQAVPTPVMTLALMMRKGFGGHAVKAGGGK